ncbi:hypothetical protein GCM10010425_50000 [Streptomyces spororaveus]|uniref:Uncharacterized protein n=1 Tax=Streptomyces spororaveus TaxID=284039 RepID=A0ABQ3T2H3_9ACTN|nr:hypothetical protein Sspor_01550 [Streptomyces spororaveus]
MPKKQNTAARRARAAARSGAKYTTALRAAVGPLPPHLPVVDEEALTDGNASSWITCGPSRPPAGSRCCSTRSTEPRAGAAP